MGRGPYQTKELWCEAIEVRRPSLARTSLVVLALLIALALLSLGPIGLLLGLGIAVVGWRASAGLGASLQRGGTVMLERDGLRIALTQGSSRWVPLSSIRAGYELPTDRAAVLELREGSEIVLTMERDGPRRVLDHVGVGPTQRALAMPLRRTLGAFTIGLFTFLGAWFGGALAGLFLFEPWLSPGSIALGALALAALVTALVVARIGFPRVVVGADGLRLLGVLRPRFIPHEEVTRAEVLHAHPAFGVYGSPRIRVHRRERPPIDLPTIAMPAERMEALARRIEDAAAAYARGDARRLEVLARGSRSVDAWSKDLARLAAGAPGFRDQALGRDDFERVLSDVAAPADHRIAAAIALRAIDPGAAPARIRVAVEASADEHLRAAFEAAAAGELDEPTLERATARRTVD